MTRETSTAKESGSAWIPMRQEGLGQSHREQVGAFSWTPNFILYGNKLEVNAQAAENLIGSMQLTNTIEIGSFNPPREDSLNMIGSISNKGEATATGVKGSIKRPKESARFVVDNDSRKIKLLVNFSGIASYVESKLPEGTNNPVFYQKFGEEVDRAVSNKLKLVPTINWALQAQDRQSVFFTEMVTTLICITPGLILNLREAIEMISGRSEGLVEEALPLLLATIALYEFGLCFFNASVLVEQFSESRDSVRRDWARYLLEGMETGQFGRFFYPENLTKYLFLPTMRAITSNETIIRGR